MEEFGFDEEPVVAQAATTPVDTSALEAVIESLTKQLAATMDESERGKLKVAKSVAETELANIRASNKEEAKALVKPPTTRKPRAKKDEAPKELVMNTPESRWPAIVLHGQQCGHDAQLIFDELGLGLLTHDSCNQVLAEINRRVTDCKTPTTPISPPAISQSQAESTSSTSQTSTTIPSTSSTPSPQSTQSITAEGIQGYIDPETGEILDRSWVLNRLGLSDFPTTPDLAVADKVVNLLHTYLEPASRYRAQAEKRAKPLEERAKAIEKVFGDFLDACGEKFLPKYQSGKNIGKYSKKTLDLESGSISWTKEGGTCCTDEAKFHVWLSEKKQEMLAARDAGDAETLQQLENTYGIKLKTEVDYSRDKIKAAVTLPPGWTMLEPDEFARRAVK